MPRSVLQWTLFLVGLAAATALAVLTLRHDGRTARLGAATARHAATAPTRTPRHVVPRPTAETTTTTSTTTVTTTTTGAATGRLLVRITARADTWLAVRRSTSRGILLYQGTLRRGASRAFAGDVLWFRFGAAANVAAELNGKPLSLPGGTYSVSVSRTGLGTRRA